MSLRKGRRKNFAWPNQVSLTGWQNHQWERARNKARAEGTAIPPREAYANLKRNR